MSGTKCPGSIFSGTYFAISPRGLRCVGQNNVGGRAEPRAVASVLKGMKPKLDVTERDVAKHMKNFEQQPPANRELELMEDQAEKSIGAEKVKTNRKIRAKSPQAGKPTQ